MMLSNLYCQSLLAKQNFPLLSRNLIVTLRSAVDLKYEWQTSFLSDFIVPLRVEYKKLFKQRKYSSFKGICSQDHWKCIVTEVSFHL